MNTKKKIDDLKPFKHGQEGTHYACQERSEKLGGKVTCCECSGHQCGITYPTPEPSEDWEEELKLYLTSAGDRRRTVHFIKKLLVKKEKALIEKIEKNLVNIFPKEGSIKENKDWSTSEREMYEDCLTAIQHYLNSLKGEDL